MKQERLASLIPRKQHYVTYPSSEIQNSTTSPAYKCYSAVRSIICITIPHCRHCIANHITTLHRHAIHNIVLPNIIINYLIKNL